MQSHTGPFPLCSVLSLCFLLSPIASSALLQNGSRMTLVTGLALEVLAYMARGAWEPFGTELHSACRRISCLNCFPVVVLLMPIGFTLFSS